MTASRSVFLPVSMTKQCLQVTRECPLLMGGGDNFVRVTKKNYITRLTIPPGSCLDERYNLYPMWLHNLSSPKTKKYVCTEQTILSVHPDGNIITLWDLNFQTCIPVARQEISILEEKKYPSSQNCLRIQWWCLLLSLEKAHMEGHGESNVTIQDLNSKRSLTVFNYLFLPSLNTTSRFNQHLHCRGLFPCPMRKQLYCQCPRFLVVYQFFLFFSKCMRTVPLWIINSLKSNNKLLSYWHPNGDNHRDRTDKCLDQDHRVTETFRLGLIFVLSPVRYYSCGLSLNRDCMMGVGFSKVDATHGGLQSSLGLTKATHL